MLDKILKFVIEQRWIVLLAVFGMAALGVYNYQRLPIDAVPDITNVQVQINTEATGYSPLEAEQRITFPLETAMAGLPGLEQTRSLSRYGLSQVTVIFKDGTDIYFARQLVNERIQEARSKLPPGTAPSMGPISTGLGEVYWWSVEYAPPGEGAPVRDGKPGWQTDGSYLTAEGEVGDVEHRGKGADRHLGQRQPPEEPKRRQAGRRREQQPHGQH